ncbi:sugar ABC transporter substrate-binding protein [Hypericibacter adhaerens]|uniref:Sugar ABC transporter substrate-binding protein n=1 Tax=Hypericibacter adhaerens TaxID=2602016 RepID=A0A5J6N699_9PROT|nr:substrate-binding domain-containing protein [Hypericibacter adhaerens]QEX24455.1 sugar ABC transporter substrate-binding protein [Hypericibacter adhaerens]
MSKVPYCLSAALAFLCMAAATVFPALAQDTVKARQITIAVENMGMSGEWFSEFVAGYQAEAKKIPGLKLVEAQANFEPGTEVSQLKALVAQKPDGILINHAPNASALAPIIKQATEQGIKMVTAELGEFDFPGVINVQQFNSDLATQGLDLMAKDLNDEGNIVVIWVGAMAPQQQRIQVLQGWLKQHPKIKVLTQYGNASGTTLSDTIAKTKAVLNQYPKIDAFWVTWDAFAQGVVQAEEQTGKHIPIYSVDVSNEDIEIMRKPNSPWRATAAADAVAYGATSLRALVLSIYGQEVPGTINVPGILITQDNLPKPGQPITEFFEEQLPAQKELSVTPFLKSLYEAKLD